MPLHNCQRPPPADWLVPSVGGEAPPRPQLERGLGDRKIPVRIRSDSLGTEGVIEKAVLGVPSGGLSCPRKMLGRTAVKPGGWAGCSLDPGGCLSLQQILASFTAPISEEHAWAVIHQVSQKQPSFIKPPIFRSEIQSKQQNHQK